MRKQNHYKRALAQRIADYKTFCKSNNIQMRDVAKAIGISHRYAYTAINTNRMPEVTMESLELKAIELAEKQKEALLTSIGQYKTVVEQEVVNA